MKLDVAFSELNQTMTTAFSENNAEFNSPMSEFVTVHDGQNGATFYPSVSEDCWLSWTNDRELDNPPPVNIRGKDGKDGYTPVKGVDYFDGKDGAVGKNGKDGKDGYTPIKGVDYFDGVNGADGKDGYTPIKGTDYWTEEDKSEIISDVLSRFIDVSEVGM